MIKLLTSKHEKLEPFDFNSQRQTRNVNWTKRNSSSAIAGVLNPVSPTKKTQKSPTKKPEKPKKTCYCYAPKKLKPKLYKKPKLQLQKSESGHLRRRRNTICCHAKIQRNYTEENEETGQVLDELTETREAYEEYRKNLIKDRCSCACYYHDQAEKLYRDYFRLKENARVNDVEAQTSTCFKSTDCVHNSKDGPKSNAQVQTSERLLKHYEGLNRNYSQTHSTEDDYSLTEIFSGSKTTDYTSRETLVPKSHKQISTDEEELTPSDPDVTDVSAELSRDPTVQGLKEFRERHFFETHSLPKPPPDHRCVYKYKVSDRLYPVPLNADPYGENRCVICDKPMEKGHKRRSETPVSGPLESLTNNSHQWTNKQMVQGINAQFQMQLTERDVKTFNECFKEKTRLPCYKNSMALRQQKMYGSKLKI